MTDKIREAYELYGTIDKAAEALGMPRSTFYYQLSKPKSEEYSLEHLPEDDIPVDDIVNHLQSRFQKRKTHKEATKWRKIKMKSNKPIGLLWMGDPHIDDNYCDWDSLRQHIEIIASYDGIYGCSVGDYQNNWVGRLGRLYGKQDTSHETAWKLVQWLIESINPMILIAGNHDMWSGAGDPLKWIASPHTIMQDWEARVSLEFPNGRECKIHAAHDFSGHSQWNALHGNTKVAKFKQHAELYICGHRHNWALSQIENVERETTSWLARCRGYKFHDDYAFVKGFEQQNFGQAILQVIDPTNPSPVSWVQCFADPENGADYLKWRQSLQQQADSQESS